MNARPGIIGITLLFVVMLLAMAGCRQKPSESPQYYQRELDQMRKEQLNAQRVEPAVKDWYPWRGKPPYRPQPDISQRIKMRDQEMKCEIDYLKEVVRGKTKVRVRFRD